MRSLGEGGGVAAAPGRRGSGRSTWVQSTALLLLWALAGGELARQFEAGAFEVTYADQGSAGQEWERPAPDQHLHDGGALTQLGVFELVEGEGVEREVSGAWFSAPAHGLMAAAEPASCGAAREKQVGLPVQAWVRLGAPRGPPARRA